jgi:PAS domain S-box-containing protein
MKIKTGFRIVLMVWAAVTVVAVLAFAYSQRALFEDSQRSQRIERVVDEGTQLVQLTYEVLFYGESRAAEQWRRQFLEVDAAVEDVRSISDPALRGMLDALFHRFFELRPMKERLTDIRLQQPDAAAVSILSSQLFQDSIKLQASLRELKAFSDTELKKAYQTSKERQLLVFGLFAGFIVVYGVVALAFFRVVVLRPLEDLGQTIHDLRDGRPTRAHIRDDDEIGAVCLVFNALLDEQESARRDLQAMGERFRNVFEQAAVGMSIISPKGTWMEANQCLCDILGVPRERLIGSSYESFTPAENAVTDKARVKAILGGERIHDSWETRHVRDSGEMLDARITTTLARGGDGQPLYFVTVTEDITERKHAELTIRRINRQLEEHAKVLKRANADLESYAWVASHDLREPLRMVSTYVAMIEKKLGHTLDGDLRDYLQFAVGGAKRMDLLIRNLLEYARIGQDDVVAEVDLSKVMAHSLRVLAQAIREEGAEITLPEQLPRVWGVEEDLKRLFDHLITNALKYRDPNRSPRIAISMIPDGPDWWTVSIADNGIGIDADYHERIFRIFQRLHTQPQYEGTGIGLAICKKIVERAGGRIWLDSIPGQGSTFHFSLPASQDQTNGAR